MSEGIIIKKKKKKEGSLKKKHLHKNQQKFSLLYADCGTLMNSQKTAAQKKKRSNKQYNFHTFKFHK